MSVWYGIPSSIALICIWWTSFWVRWRLIGFSFFNVFRAAARAFSFSCLKFLTGRHSSRSSDSIKSFSSSSIGSNACYLILFTDLLLIQTVLYIFDLEMPSSEIVYSLFLQMGQLQHNLHSQEDIFFDRIVLNFLQYRVYSRILSDRQFLQMKYLAVFSIFHSFPNANLNISWYKIYQHLAIVNIILDFQYNLKFVNWNTLTAYQ